MSGDFSPESYLKSNSWKELHQSFEECKQQLQHEIDTREMLSKVNTDSIELYLRVPLNKNNIVFDYLIEKMSYFFISIAL